MSLCYLKCKRLVTFSLTLMLEERALFTFFWRRWINSSLFELICLNIWRETKDPTCLLKILFHYTQKNNANITCLLKIVLIFMNICPCKPPNMMYQSTFLDNQILRWRREHFVLLTSKIIYIKDFEKQLKVTPLSKKKTTWKPWYYKKLLKEIRNSILYDSCVWSLFCSIWVYLNLPFLPIILGN